MRIDFSFLVFNALIFLLRDSGLIMAFYAVCAIHEVGHIAALRVVGGRLSGVEMSGVGIRMETAKRSLYSLRSSLFVLIAGPAANFIVYAIFGTRFGKFPMLNLAAALYNLLPYRSLDGGAIIALFTLGTPHERTAELILGAVKVLIIAAALAVMTVCGRAAMPLLIASIGLFIGDMAKK
ncbi:MAG: hypothetical protein K6G33_00435 [Ruminococcus sp.]|uniref:hypothetical protein n=1 Tax=Ruminococcus sp. TaxID=41978 RepID=UPI0025E9B6F6|nr:hypothetical protein [Ruminococcus sp.]MCR5599200.1 hypothetical protein [Ruminococcus sp.]